MAGEWRPAASEAPSLPHSPPCREYARALALVASKAPRPAWTTFFCRCANEAYLEEQTFHSVSWDMAGLLVPILKERDNA